MAQYTGAIPVPTPESRPFWDAAQRHALELPFCRGCGKAHYYPRALCPHCLSPDLEWRQTSGRGTLHTFTVVHRGAKDFPLGTPYVMAIVELEEGPRLMTNLVGVTPDPAALRIGMPVQVEFRDVTAQVTLPLFRPAERTR